jgi:hypothetical protein
MAITVMGGLMFSTVLTLFFIPVVYDVVDRKVMVADDEPAAPQAMPSRLEGWQPAPGGQQQPGGNL